MQVVPVCEQHSVDAVITGHERSLQHITGTYNPGVNFVVSGGGGRQAAQYDMVMHTVLFPCDLLHTHWHREVLT